MKINFGKYSGKEITCIINDTNYKEWLLKQSFFKEKYPEIYNAVINYKEIEEIEEIKENKNININFFELVEKSLNNDILEKISEYLVYKQDKIVYSDSMVADTSNSVWNYMSFCWTGLKYANTELLMRSFRHKRNIYAALVDDTIINMEGIKLSKNNCRDWLKKQEYIENMLGYNFFITNENGTNAESCYDWLIRNHYEDLVDEVSFMDSWKIKFGKYKDKLSFKDIYELKDYKQYSHYQSENCKTTLYKPTSNNRLLIFNDKSEEPFWKVLKYIEWFVKNCTDKYDLLGMYFYAKDKLKDAKFNRRTFYN